MKIESLVTIVTAVGSPDRTECTILGVILAGRVFWLIQDIFVVAEPLCYTYRNLLLSRNTCKKSPRITAGTSGLLQQPECERDKSSLRCDSVFNGDFDSHSGASTRAAGNNPRVPL